MDYRTKARRARLRLIMMGTAATAALVAGGLLAVSVSDSSPRRAKPASDRAASASPAPGKGTYTKYTPATAPPVRLLKPDSAENGIGTGFPHSARGATSAAVSYWQDLSLVDDQAAERQLRTIAASPADPAVRNGVSEVRKVREGVGLPPSGGPPNGITFTTDVKAALIRSLDSRGEVIQVWMVFDRYGTSPDKGTDPEPLRDEVDNLILTWEQGDWKVTEAAKWVRKSTAPRSYDPHGTYAFQDGWREVTGD
ncbi:hypothetical protein [Streptomyces qinglanensis]|uniref:Uncharacterized protein n=1 Tax=Streptomyces qinglanensis TaxID=943816 RepID=A0A1H9WXC3_9ACTN|nr:hypothetical protein [Streptomyces qinglanensis]SES38337.1 hypothetical protein SAMN05421870_12315 [Streptomyces qinglanensis]